MNWRLFLQGMSDFEFECLDKAVYRERDSRALHQAQKYSPTEEETKQALGGDKLGAIKSFRVRTNADLLMAKRVIEKAMNDAAIKSIKA